MKKVVIILILMASIFMIAGCQKTEYSSHSVVYIPEKKLEEQFIKETVITETILSEKTWENSTTYWD